MKTVLREKLKDSVQALKGAAIGIAASIDQEDDLMTGEQVYHLLNTIAELQMKLMGRAPLTQMNCLRIKPADKSWGCRASFFAGSAILWRTN